MRKNILKSTLFVAIMAASGTVGYVSYSQYQNRNSAFANPLMEENIEALAEPGDGWDCMITKEDCRIKVKTTVQLDKLKNILPGVALGVTVNLRDFTTIYALNDGSAPKVRCGSDCNCQCVLSKIGL